MLYPNELVQYKPKPASRGGLLLFKTPVRRRSYFDLAKYRERIISASVDCTIHGMHYIFDKGQRNWQRYFWLLVVVSAAFGFFVSYSILSQRHSDPLITIVETTQLPVYNIEFPAVAICPWNRVNWQRVPFISERFLPQNSGAAANQTLHDLLVVMESLMVSNFDIFEIFAAGNHNLISENFDLNELASYVAYRCDEIFIKDSCIFDETTYDCCELFVPERTELGYCLVFNSLISENSRKKRLINQFYPFKLSTAGEASGLMFTLNLNSSYVRPGSSIPFRVNLMMKEPTQWSDPLTYILQANTENFLTIRPRLLETSNSTRNLRPQKRRCFFNSELPRFIDGNDIPYSRQNCLVICKQRHLHEACNCTLTMFFPPYINQRECNVPDFKCIYEHRDLFSYVRQFNQSKYIKDPRRGLHCTCLESCYKVEYSFSLNVRSLDNTNGSKTLIKVDIHYGSRLLTKYVTKMQYTWLDLLANFGGILGLFLGASALSLAQLAYINYKLIVWLLCDLRRALQEYFGARKQRQRQRQRQK